MPLDNVVPIETEEKFENFQKLPNTKEIVEKFCGDFRQEFGKDYQKKPVIIFGCSYAYGHGLKREESFPYLISDITKRPVINFAQCGEEALYNFSSNIFKYIKKEENKKTLQNAEYIVYVYMRDHINRFYSLTNIMDGYDRLFKPSKIEHKLIQIYSIRYILSLIRIRPYMDRVEEWFEHVLITIHNNMRMIAPNAKIIVIIYDEKLEQENLLVSKMNYSDIWDKYSKLTGDTVIHTKDITGFVFDRNYKLNADIADWHPNAKAWEVFTPKFVEKYIL